MPQDNHLETSFFEPVTEADSHIGRYVGTRACAGPWSLDLMHGGPPSALLVRAAERQAAQDTGRDDLDALRVSLDFLGPVPVGEVEVSATTVRTGRSVVLVDTELAAQGRTCLRARTWLVRRAAEPTPEVTAASPVGAHPERLETFGTWHFPYAAHVDWRLVSGDATRPGPATVWARQRVPLVPGEEPAGLERTVLVADSASGVSSVLSWDDWSFVNVDLDLHLARPLAGEWVLMDAQTVLAPSGSGLATSRIADLDGDVGQSSATLVVSPRDAG